MLNVIMWLSGIIGGVLLILCLLALFSCILLMILDTYGRYTNEKLEGDMMLWVLFFMISSTISSIPCAIIAIAK